MTTLLDALRTVTKVDCDTLDAEVAKSLGPFENHTSNQAIAYGELTKKDPVTNLLVYDELIAKSVKTAKELLSKYPTAVEKELVADVMTVNLSIKFLPYLTPTGSHLVQTDPFQAHSVSGTVEHARRLHSLFTDLRPDFPKEKICIKVPGTFAGLTACGHLEKEGINTLATMIFSMEQVAMARKMQCKLIAPYVNELKVHFEPGFKDEKKAFALCGTAQRYLAMYPRVVKGGKKGTTTGCMPASLTSVEEVMRLAGVDYITIYPPMLREMAKTPSEGWECVEEGRVVGDVFVVSAEKIVDEKEKAVELDELVGPDSIEVDEEKWNASFDKSIGGDARRKLDEAVKIFSGMQEKLVKFVENEMSKLSN